MKPATRAFVLMLTLGACAGGDDPAVPSGALPEYFPDPIVPADNVASAERIALGRRMFYDKRLSRDETVACGSCHLQEHAFSDPRAVSVGFAGRKGKRNAPALVNLAWGESFFWDGGVETLERQAVAPIVDENEMNLPIEEAAARLAADPLTAAEFQSAYGEGPTPALLTRALAVFVRSLVSANSRYDRFKQGDSGALTASEKRGMDVFLGERGECFHCHTGFNFTNERYVNNGATPAGGDPGRARVVQNPIYTGSFKVPTLRNVGVTAPYMHDGSILTLEEVVERYNQGGLGDPLTNSVIKPLHLTDEEKRDLIAFLRALTDDAFLKDTRFAPPAP